MSEFERDVSLDRELFEILEKPKSDTADLVRAKRLVQLICGQDYPHLLLVVRSRTANTLDEDQEREVVDRLAQHLMKQVLRQLGGTSVGLRLSREASQSVFRWECVKLGEPFHKDVWRRGILGNFIRELTQRGVEDLDEEKHPAAEPEVIGSLQNRQYASRVLGRCSEYPKNDGWLLELWVRSTMEGLTTSVVLEIASRHGVKRPSIISVRRALKNAARDHGNSRPSPDEIPVCDLTYEHLVELASTSTLVSLSKVQKTVAAFKRRISEEDADPRR